MSTLPWNEMLESSEDDGYRRVPDGWYDCVIKSAEAGKTSNGYEKIDARFVVESGPYAGSSLFKGFVLTPDKPGGLKFFFRHLGVLGVTRDYIKAQQPTIEQLAVTVVDRRAQVLVGTRVWNDQERAEVKDLKALVGEPGAIYAPSFTLPSPSVPIVPGGVAGLSEPLPSMPTYVYETFGPGGGPDAPTPLPSTVPTPFPDNELPPEPPF